MIGWAVEALLASTILMLVVLAVRVPVRRAFGPGVAYALWALPLLRMALPPLPAGWRGATLPVLPVAEDITISLGQPVAVLAAAPATGPGWPAVALALWAAGGVAFALYHMAMHHRFVARVRAGARGVRHVADGRVRVIESDAAAGPIAFGVLRRYVAFPRDFAERYDPLERDLALAHELGHHARGDLLANWAGLAVLAVHWFNPVAWRAYRAFRADQELACDALVLAGRAPSMRQAYGRAILKSAHGGAVSAACHLHTVNAIKGRLRMLARHRTTGRGRRLAGAGAIAALTAAGLGATASGTAAAERVRERVVTVTGVERTVIDAPLAQIVPPALPEPPTPPARPAAPAARGDTALVGTAQRARPAGTFTIRTADGGTISVRGDTPAEFEGVTSVRTERRACRAGEGAADALFHHRREGDRLVTTICTNRIDAIRDAARRAGLDAARAGEAARLSADDARRIAGRAEVTARMAELSAVQATRMAGMTARFAETTALSSLRSARRSIERAEMTDEQRTTALAGIAQAERELEARRD